MTVKIVDATPLHFNELAQRMREVDRKEIYASSGNLPKDVCDAAWGLDKEAKVALVGGRVVCIFGVVQVSALPTIGVPWLLGTDLMDDVPKDLCKHSVKHLNKFKKKYDVMVNYVDARNKTTVKWLQWLGFSVELPASFGYLGLPFHRFEMRKDYNV